MKRNQHNRLVPKDFSTLFYTVWSNMKCRVDGRSAKKNYFDRGIGIDSRWSIYENFVTDMWESYYTHFGNNAGDTQIDRINNDLGYSEENCRWVTASQNSRNTRQNVWLEHNGKKMVISDWATELQIDRRTLSKRLKQGWSVEKTLSTPKISPYEQTEARASASVRNIINYNNSKNSIYE